MATTAKTPTTDPIMMISVLELEPSESPGPEHSAVMVNPDVADKQAETGLTLVGEPWQEPLLSYTSITGELPRHVVLRLVVAVTVLQLLVGPWLVRMVPDVQLLVSVLVRVVRITPEVGGEARHV